MAEARERLQFKFKLEFKLSFTWKYIAAACCSSHSFGGGNPDVRSPPVVGYRNLEEQAMLEVTEATDSVEINLEWNRGKSFIERSGDGGRD